jgi:hypothetical protein
MIRVPVATSSKKDRSFDGVPNFRRILNTFSNVIIRKYVDTMEGKSTGSSEVELAEQG